MRNDPLQEAAKQEGCHVTRAKGGRRGEVRAELIHPVRVRVDRASSFDSVGIVHGVNGYVPFVLEVGSSEIIARQSLEIFCRAAD
jgi:hypothetical protein